MNFNKLITIVFLTALFAISSTGTQPLEIRDAAELQIALEKLHTLGSVLYIAAHPDDENTAALAYFSKGRKYRTAYLSLTRGDGGQNLIGSEKGAEIGIIRTQELLEARKIDGAEQFFSRAIDFGYSKTYEETLDIWGKELILADIVWVIRTFRPDVIISRFSPGGSGGHGHHTASTMLVQEAFNAASNPNTFPEQLKYVEPWQVTRLFWNSFRPGQQEQEKLLRINIGEYDQLLGKSYTEIAAESRSMHKTQGFGTAGRRGIRYDYYEFTQGISPATDLLDGIDTTWNRVPGGQKIDSMLNDILTTFDPHNPSESIPSLLEVYEELNRFEKNFWVDIKKKEILHVIRNCAGLWLEAVSDNFAASPGDEILIRMTAVNRSNHPFTLEKIWCPEIAFDSGEKIPMNNNDPLIIEKTLLIPRELSISQPYWLKEPYSLGTFSVSDQNQIGLAEKPPSICVRFTISSGNKLLEYSVPLLFRWTDRVDGELYRPFEIRPVVTVNFEDKVCIFGDNSPKEITVKVKSHTPDITGRIRLKGPATWKIQPATTIFSLTDKFEEKYITFTVLPPQYPDEAILVAEAEIDGKIYDKSLVEISHPHIKKQLYFPVSRVKVVKLDIAKQGVKVGYIMGAGDEIPDALNNLGYEVNMLDDEKLESIDLSQFDAVITGIRTYNTRERLRHAQPLLLQYVENGGTLIVQYNVSSGLITKEIGPYPFTIGRDRISVETAPVSFLNPDHQLLNFPNRIEQKDFEGWVQERGLYFASQWDNNYEQILSSHDPNEPDKKGGMLFTRYGKGIFMYTGYSWFRQLPAGVPGAYRLFVNMISAGYYNGK
ncbi:PIG-L family deacetylase [Candidatus Latescibacterota bacterium]